MSKKKSFLVILLIILIFSSCKNFVNIDKARLSINIENLGKDSKNISRTIIPEYDLESLDLSISLVGCLNDSMTEQTIKTWTSSATESAYSVMSLDDEIYIDTGIWVFTINVIKNGMTILTSTISDKTIVEGTNLLDFGVLTPTIIEDETSDFCVTLYYPAASGATYIAAGLYSFSAGELVAVYEPELLIEYSGTGEYEGKNYVEYEKTGVPVGSYIVKFLFDTDDDHSELMNVFTESIWVTPSMENTSILETTKMNTPYSIMYNRNDGDWTDESTIIKSYNQFMAVTLPSIAQIKRTNFTFAGWYEDAAFTGEPVTEISVGSKQDKVYYAKWVVDPANAATAISGLAGGPYTIYVSGVATTVDISNIVTAINDSSVSINLDLSEVTGIDIIEIELFAECSGLIGITLPNGVKSIGDGAFYKCDNLESVKLPESIETISGSVFAFTTALTSIIIPESVTTIGDSAFASSKITSIIIPNKETSLANRVFSGCEELISVDLPDNLEIISESLFESCSKLESINIPTTVTSIGNRAFYGCGLISINIPDNVTSIGDYAYSGCTKLESFEIPKSTTTIGSRIFTDSGVTTLSVATDNTTFMAEDNVLFNREKTELICYPPAKEITEYTVPTGVTSIGESAFYACKKLEKVVLNSELTTLKTSAFMDCTKITSVSLPDSITTIETYVFSGCSGLSSLTIPKDVVYLGQYAFKDLTLTTITFKDYTGWHYLSDTTNWKNKTGGTLQSFTSEDIVITEFTGSDTIKYYWYNENAISYNGNSNTGGTAPTTQIKEEGTDLIIAANTFEKTGFTFAGWNTAPDGTGTTYAAGSTYSIEDDLILYAVWLVSSSISGIAAPTVESSYLTVAEETSSVTFTATKTADTYYWYLDGTIQTSVNSETWTLDTTNLSAGIHTILLVIPSDGFTYSTQYELTIKK